MSIDAVIFNEDQILNGEIIHKKGKKYECISSDGKDCFIRTEQCPEDKNWCSRIPNTCEGTLFTFTTMEDSEDTDWDDEEIPEQFDEDGYNNETGYQCDENGVYPGDEE